MNRYFAARGWVLAALFAAVLWARARVDAPLEPLWLLLVAAAIAVRLWAGAHLGNHGNASQPQARQADEPGRSGLLCQTGPYAFSRNPLYLSNILGAAGIILYANAFSPWMEAAILPGVVLHHAILVRHEENALRSLLGAEYENYARAVPRWLGIADKTGAKNGGGVSLPALLRRQGRNILYTLLCVAAVWVAAR